MAAEDTVSSDGTHQIVNLSLTGDSDSCTVNVTSADIAGTNVAVISAIAKTLTN